MSDMILRPSECVCGEPATTYVLVDWVGGPQEYRYCAECAHDIVDICEGAEIVP